MALHSKYVRSCLLRAGKALWRDKWSQEKLTQVKIENISNALGLYLFMSKANVKRLGRFSYFEAFGGTFSIARGWSVTVFPGS